MSFASEITYILRYVCAYRRVIYIPPALKVTTEAHSHHEPEPGLFICVFAIFADNSRCSFTLVISFLVTTPLQTKLSLFVSLVKALFVLTQCADNVFKTITRCFLLSRMGMNTPKQYTPPSLVFFFHYLNLWFTSSNDTSHSIEVAAEVLFSCNEHIMFLSPVISCMYPPKVLYILRLNWKEPGETATNTNRHHHLTVFAYRSEAISSLTRATYYSNATSILFSLNKTVPVQTILLRSIHLIRLEMFRSHTRSPIHNVSCGPLLGMLHNQNAN